LFTVEHLGGFAASCVLKMLAGAVWLG
jgi:hypothetical protein